MDGILALVNQERDTLYLDAIERLTKYRPGVQLKDIENDLDIWEK